MRSRLFLAGFGLSLALGAGAGCLVQSQCAADYDCASGERCNMQNGSCFVECRTDRDCYQNGVYFGKHCIQSRCEFRFDERVQAPGFCMKVVNPKSTSFEKEWCLSNAKGKVTILYFAWLT